MPHLDATPTPNIPGAWYDLTARIDAAQSVTSCALEAVPRKWDAWGQGNHCSNLIAANQDLLALMAADAEMIAKQMKL